MAVRGDEGRGWGKKQESLEGEGEEEEEGELPLEKGQRGTCAGARPRLQRGLGSQLATRGPCRE